jgi:hypothetical protein
VPSRDGTPIHEALTRGENKGVFIPLVF